MPIRAIVLDIGGVLEHTPDTGVYQRWDAEFGPGWGERVAAVFEAGELGRVTLDEVHERAVAALGVPAARFEAFMEEVWVDYLGTYNAEMADYWRGRRAEGYATAIRFSALTDLIVYSHEVGVKKPDPATARALGMSAVLFQDTAQTIRDLDALLQKG